MPLAATDMAAGPIKTVVVLVMENRSFDHMLGWMKRLNPEIDGLTGNEFNPLSTTDPIAQKVFVSDGATYVDPADPGHSFQAMKEQIFGSDSTSANPPPMNGFAQEAEKESKGLSKAVMSAFKPEMLPVYASLVTEFAVFDRWFASIPTSTQPNRAYIHSATSHGLMSNVTNDLIKGFPQKTIFDSIAESGLSFGIYYQNVPSTLFYDSLRQPKYASSFRDYYLFFKQHAAQGLLPNYTVIEPIYLNQTILPANDDHPVHNVSEGQKLVKEVYETLRQSPQWNEMLLIITYDEHGGFYDHVPTPVKNVPNPDGLNGPAPYFFKFDRLGVRVPTIMVSPWINKGTVVHEPNGPTPDSHFEHSSIPATVKRIFNLKSDFLSKRDAWAGTFESILAPRSTPRTDCPATLPNVPASSNALFSLSKGSDQLSEFQAELVHLAAQLQAASQSQATTALDFLHSSLDHIKKALTVDQAQAFASSSVSQFLKANENAFKSGSSHS
ncbi:hypothetical protein O6H91_04G068500 [Diphasiastrum complanatum]|uniref:Uncharacterized protein n=1 Tax=Diphasiastrum complanatum TaxID=34168 RepID=A0ACC2DXT3_DIPCM|nr:hypothetical protein O6H91_04G068500 [Diphasiastrum complanatum]